MPLAQVASVLREGATGDRSSSENRVALRPNREAPLDVGLAFDIV